MVRQSVLSLKNECNNLKDVLNIKKELINVTEMECSVLLYCG